MAGYNRKRGTYCAWCGETVTPSTGVLARVQRLDVERPALLQPLHRTDCAETYASVMRADAYSVTYREERAA